MTSSISGIGSGLDVNSIVDQLMQIEKQGQTRVIQQRNAVQTRLDALTSVRSKFTALTTAANALDQKSSWSAFTTSSSNTDAVTATAQSTATTGSLTFTVDQLATTAAVRSSNTIASTGTVVASGNLLVAKGGQTLGFATLSSSGSLPVDKYEIRVTQSSAAATRTATNVLAASTVITAGVNDTVTANINGSPQTFTIAAGTYTRTQLADAVKTASGGLLNATSSATTNKLTLQTIAEGSAASIEITGGTALTDLGLDVDASAAVGVDGVVKVGDTSTTVTNITAGGSVSLAATTGSVNAVFSGGLRVGAINAKNVNVGSGTLTAVVNAINQSNVGVSAAAVKVGTNAYRLQITSSTAGSSGRLNLDTSAFSAVGGLTTMSAGTDAKITIGEGAGAYSVESASNAVTTVLPGVTLNLQAVSTEPVTVSVARDPGALADKLQALTKAANDTIAEIKRQTAYDATSKKGGPLSGTSAMRSMLAAVTTAVTGAVGGNSLGAGNQVGLSVTRDGTISFDRTKFIDAYNDDPETVSDLFVRRGTATNSDVAFSGATTRTRAGTYAVNVTTAATRAATSGSVLGSGTITAAETIDLQLGTKNATYAAAAGESLTDIAAGINAALGASGMALSASVSGNQLLIQATGYGTAGSFSVRSDATGAGQTGIASASGTWEAHNGINVAGTIGGKAATGSGNTLSIAASDETIPGLAVAITATSPGALGTISYAPGIAARLALAANNATDSKNGSLTAAESGSRSMITRFNKDITDWDRRLADRQMRLKLQYASLDTTLGQLKSQASWVSSQLSSLG